MIDAHVHFWNPAALHYPWLDSVPALQRAFGPTEYEVAVKGRVGRVVVVEANALPSESAAEVAYIEGLKGGAIEVAAVVAYADMTDARSEDVLAALAARPLVRGVRQNIQGHGAGFCTTAEFVRGVRAAGQRGLTFDLCITYDQLPDAVALARACPDTTFVLDHGGKPPIRDAMPDSWRDGVCRLAELQNVHAKLSGLLTEADEAHRSTDNLRPYADHLLHAFGAARVMFGSDWPVVTLAGGFERWCELTDGLTAQWTPAARERLFTGTAAAVYRLDPNRRSAA